VSDYEDGGFISSGGSVSFTLLATVSDVTMRAKEFASLGAPEIALALNDAALQVNGAQFGTKTRLAQTYLAAHFLSIRNPLLALPVGPVKSDRVDGVSSEYAVAGPPAAESDLNSSRWGRAFQTLQRQFALARIGVA
jgi:hypothetical protein